MRGVNVYRKPQHIKLSTLLDFYETDPESQYRIYVENGIMRTTIQQNYNQGISQDVYNSEHVDSFADANKIDRMAEKTVGLFANLIRNLGINKQKIEPVMHIEPTNEKPPRRQYQFYFNNIKNKDNDFFKPEIGTSTRRVKQRATGISQNIGKYQRRSNENCNEMNGQIEMIRINDKQVEKKDVGDMNFSFEDMNNLTQEKREQVGSSHSLNQGIIQIKVTQPPKQNSELRNQPSIKQEIKHQQQIIQQITFPQNNYVPVNFFSQEIKNEQFQSIPHKSRHQIKIEDQKKINFLSMNKQSQTSLVQGAKKAQSRIQQYNPKGASDQKDVQIDFDLDLNFI